MVWMSLEDVICTVFLGVESGVLSMLVFGVMENSLTSPELLKLDSYSPSEHPNVVLGLVLQEMGLVQRLVFVSNFFNNWIQSFERIVTQLEIHVGT